MFLATAYNYLSDYYTGMYFCRNFRWIFNFNRHHYCPGGSVDRGDQETRYKINKSLETFGMSIDNIFHSLH